MATTPVLKQLNKKKNKKQQQQINNNNNSKHINNSDALQMMSGSWQLSGQCVL